MRNVAAQQPLAVRQMAGRPFRYGIAAVVVALLALTAAEALLQSPAESATGLTRAQQAWSDRLTGLAESLEADSDGAVGAVEGSGAESLLERIDYHESPEVLSARAPSLVAIDPHTSPEVLRNRIHGPSLDSIDPHESPEALRSR
jgi:hypothetical protein